MDKILENVMNFINENTTLLIIICVFLILVLIGYLIDNSIKTKRLAKLEVAKNSGSTSETVIENKIEDVNVAPTVEVEEVKVEEPVQAEEEAPAIDIPDINLEEEVQEEVKEEKSPTIEVPIVPVDLPKVEEDVNIEDLPKVEEVANPEEVKANEFTIDPKINELLSRDFTKENTVIPTDEELRYKPVETTVEVTKIEVPEVEVEEKKEEVKEEKPKYKNSKSLSEILGKKEIKTKNVDADLMSTVDFQNELDRLLKQLSDEIDEENTSKDSNVEETQDFTNMF